MNRKIFHFFLFCIFLMGVSSFFSLCYNKECLNFNFNSSVSNFITHNQTSTINKDNSTDEIIDTIVFLSDSHNNSEVFSKIGNVTSKFNPSLYIHTGDLTDFGTLREISLARSDLNVFQNKIIVLPGDHDIAETSSTSNFNMFFSTPISHLNSHYKILFIPNFYNFTPFDEDVFNDIYSRIPESDIIVSSQPIFVNDDNIFSNRYMGSSEAFDDISKSQRDNLKSYNSQRILILEKIRKTGKPILVVSGDHHRSSTFGDPTNPLIKYHILGGLSKYIYFGNSKLLQSALQSQRVSVVQILLDSNQTLKYKITEVEIK